MLLTLRNSCAIALSTLVAISLIITTQCIPNKYHSAHHRAHSYVQDPSVFRGARNLTSNNCTVYGAVITTDYSGEMQALVDEAEARNNTPPHKALLATHRRAKMHEIGLQLPFPLVEWPPVRSKQCPGDNRVQHGSAERGVSLAHYQILLDFIYFDYDVLQMYNAPGGMTPDSAYVGNDYSAVSAMYAAVGPKTGSGNITPTKTAAAPSAPSAAALEEAWYQNQAPGLYKNGIPFRDDDILVIFEDDVEVAINGLDSTLREELNDMATADVLFLGWCEGRLARPIPLCAHSYAITRRGARQLVKYFEPCGLAYDWQLVTLIRNKWLTYRTAHSFSYNNNYREGFRNGATRGIFQQAKALGSFNGHRIRNRRKLQKE